MELNLKNRRPPHSSSQSLKRLAANHLCRTDRRLAPRSRCDQFHINTFICRSIRRLDMVFSSHCHHTAWVRCATIPEGSSRCSAPRQTSRRAQSSNMPYYAVCWGPIGRMSAIDCGNLRGRIDCAGRTRKVATSELANRDSVRRIPPGGRGFQLLLRQRWWLTARHDQIATSPSRSLGARPATRATGSHRQSDPRKTNVARSINGRAVV